MSKPRVQCRKCGRVGIATSMDDVADARGERALALRVIHNAVGTGHCKNLSACLHRAARKASAAA
jgi:hypothetical protein